MIMLALVDGRPKTLPLKDFLRLFVEHRVNVIRRRTQFQLRQARQRAHILEGLLDRAALHRRDHPRDPLVGQPRRGPRAADGPGGLGRDPPARARTTPRPRPPTSLTRMQADAILAMQLQRLTGLEADKLAQEYKGLKDDIAGYERDPRRRAADPRPDPRRPARAEGRSTPTRAGA